MKVGEILTSTSPSTLSPEGREGALRGPTAVLTFQFPLRPLGGEVSSTRRKGVDLGAGDETVTRYPQTGDFITNVSARQGEVGRNLSRMRPKSRLFLEPAVSGAFMAYWEVSSNGNGL
jgi:hypothetical protein